MKIKKTITLLIKLLFIIAALTFVFLSTNTKLILQHVANFPLLSLITSCVLLIIAQIVSAYRMQHYCNTHNLALSNKFSIALYFTGMLYNTILPGGISGDVYKIYLLNKLANFSKLKSLLILLSERANGLFILITITLFLLFVSEITIQIAFAKLLILVLIIINITSYFLAIKKFLNEKTKTAIGALPYSLSVQLLNIAIIIIILYGLGFDVTNYDQTNSYIILFLVSCILSVLPISIGGIGIRELTFMYGASILSTDAELGISIAIIYFVVNMACSLTGFIFWHKLEKIYLNSNS